MLVCGEGVLCNRGHCRCFFHVEVHLDLLALSGYRVPPHRACSSGTSSQTQSCNPDCASAISSIDNAALSLMKKGFEVSPGRLRALAAPCTSGKLV